MNAPYLPRVQGNWDRKEPDPFGLWELVLLFVITTLIVLIYLRIAPA